MTHWVKAEVFPFWMFALVAMFVGDVYIGHKAAVDKINDETRSFHDLQNQLSRCTSFYDSICNTVLGRDSKLSCPKQPYWEEANAS